MLLRGVVPPTSQGNSTGNSAWKGPDSDMIIVHRANTYNEPWVAVDWTEIKEIVKGILAARTEIKNNNR